MSQEYTPTELTLIRMICALSRAAIVGPDELAEEFLQGEGVQAFYDRFMKRVSEYSQDEVAGE